MCNVLPVILRANYDDPVDTVQDIIDRNLTLYMQPWMEMWLNWMAKHPNHQYRKVAETMIVSESWEQYDELLENRTMRDNTHVAMFGYVRPYEKPFGEWWKSKEVVEGDQGFGGYVTRKKWKYFEDWNK